MGVMSYGEKVMICVFALLLILWAGVAGDAAWLSLCC